MLPRDCLPLLILPLFASPAFAADPWRLPDWSARAVVEIPTPSTEQGVDAAGVKVLGQGHAKPDGSDYRVLDADGKPVPFQLDFHDADHYSLLTFKVENPKQRFYVYFGNPKAARAPSRRPTSRPPAAALPPAVGSRTAISFTRPSTGRAPPTSPRNTTRTTSRK